MWKLIVYFIIDQLTTAKHYNIGNSSIKYSHNAHGDVYVPSKRVINVAKRVCHVDNFFIGHSIRLGPCILVEDFLKFGWQKPSFGIINFSVAAMLGAVNLLNVNWEANVGNPTLS